jgi:hypothetical protein
MREWLKRDASKARQLKVDLLHFSVKGFNEKIPERQLPNEPRLYLRQLTGYFVGPEPRRVSLERALQFWGVIGAWPSSVAPAWQFANLVHRPVNSL